MLSPMLDGLLKQLRKKANRSQDENRLLRELEELEKSPLADSIFEKIRGTTVFGPSQGTCPCCGRSI